MVTVYGIPHCDTVKKARAWLTGQSVEYRFHDFKKEGVPPEHLDAWLRAAGWELLLNRKGTTWRKLDSSTQLAAQDLAGARALMLRESSVIKRPVVEWGPGAGDLTVGFDAQAWQVRLRRG